VNAGFELSTLTAFLWVPVVFVAWADGHADELEKQSILNILKSKGLPQQTADMMISHEWFRQPPSEELWTIWEEFIASTLATLNATLRNELTAEVIRLCHVVAEASGGFLGIGKTSAVEQRVIERVKNSLQRYSASSEGIEDSEAASLRSA
jgi:tellurite resistance protein